MITAHDALVILRVSFSALSMLHTLRASACYNHILLSEFYNLFRSALCKICNITLSDNQWIQASLPVRAGGLEIRRVTSLAQSAFLASAVATRELQDQILQSNSLMTDYVVEKCLFTWRDIKELPVPTQIHARKQ
jgi:hypothetical protein